MADHGRDLVNHLTGPRAGHPGGTPYFLIGAGGVDALQAGPVATATGDTGTSVRLTPTALQKEDERKCG